MFLLIAIELYTSLTISLLRSARSFLRRLIISVRSPGAVPDGTAKELLAKLQHGIEYVARRTRPKLRHRIEYSARQAQPSPHIIIALRHVEIDHRGQADPHYPVRLPDIGLSPCSTSVIRPD